MANQGAGHVPDDVTISRWLYLVLRESCRMAGAQGRGRVDTGHVLAGMAEGLPDVGRVLRLPQNLSSGAPTGERIRPDTGSARLPEVLGPLRLAAWEARQRTDVVSTWDGEVASCLGEAFDLAMVSGERQVGNRHLLSVFLRPGAGRAHDLISRYADEAALEQFRYLPWPDVDARPYDYVADYLAECRLIAPAGATVAAPPRWLSLMMRVTAEASFVYSRLEHDAVREAVKLGHSQVQPVHLLLAVLVMETRVAASGSDWVTPYDRFNSPVLTTAGMTWHQLVEVLPERLDEAPPAPARPRRAWRGNSSMLPWSVAAARIADRGRGLVGERRLLGSHHLVQAMLNDEDDQIRDVLATFDLDQAVLLRTEP